MIKLNTFESIIIEALGNDILTFEQLAAKTGYEVSGHFRRTVSSLSKRGILGNKRPAILCRRSIGTLSKSDLHS
jgi:hypothetical protein